MRNKLLNTEAQSNRVTQSVFSLYSLCSSKTLCILSSVFSKIFYFGAGQAAKDRSTNGVCLFATAKIRATIFDLIIFKQLILFIPSATLFW